MNEALTSIKGIGPGREKQLHKLGIDTVSNLLAYFHAPMKIDVKFIP